MSEPKLIPYRLCCCEEDGTCHGCGSVVVFAPDAEAALALGRDWLEEPDAALAHQEEELEVLRPLWRGEVLAPGRPKAYAARLWRLARWGDAEGWRCLECGLAEWENVPESKPARPDDEYPEFCVECELDGRFELLGVEGSDLRQLYEFLAGFGWPLLDVRSDEEACSTTLVLELDKILREVTVADKEKPDGPR